ncbi:MAG TPA: sugar ABC transporter substrate-binding protein [Chthonomonas sp.]|uniref:ABC transporter substrate-binding protein n=1 Tax=Chthonomonas sp. TaxID=2282153 RepID=UPI002B4AED4F|nr:sugar ABC transporter substrate-binding protein [Chthonomonas sp.]HLH81490.1 sugar ABC transporter substrate-binding protein [Chthonomonas sp.]
MVNKKVFFQVAFFFSVFFLLTGCNSNSNPSGPTVRGASALGNHTLVIAWAQWKPSDYLQTLSEDFTRQTGIPVKVEQIPWSQYQQKIQTDVWAGKSDAYDLIVGDSQWLGHGATEGHYVDLTDWSKTNVPWQDYTDNIKKFYCEYNGKIWALPCEADALGFAYRKDLFENPTEQANFKAKYGYPLAPPKTWQQFRDIAEFFTRPQQHLYGCALFYAGPVSYDGVTMGFMQVLWCLGGEFFDPKTGAVEGYVNSPASVKALDFYTRELKQFTPPHSENYYFNETLDAFKSGEVAMALDWFTFFPALVDKSQNRYADVTGFFESPAGPAGHWISLGGQGISISAYSKHIDEAKKFLAWFSSEDTQRKWALLGGLTCNSKVLSSPEFLNATPFNRVFAESVPLLRDFYNNPAYADLLNVTQEEFNAAATGQVTAQQAMDIVAQKHTEILKRAGLLK